MVLNYFNLVTLKRYTCNPNNKEAKLVHPRFRDEVMKMLEKEGYDLDGNKIESVE